KTIKVRIIDDEEYEKNKTFYLEIGEPRLVDSNDTKGQERGRGVPDPVNFDPVTPGVVEVNMQQDVDHLISPHPPPCHEKTITLRILDREEYNKQASFYLLLEVPQWRRSGRGWTEEGLKEEEEEEEEALTGKDEEERRIAEMGRPMLGDHVKLEVIIEESYEFKNTVDKLIKKTNLALLVGTNSWRDQFIEAITVSA
ncbi:sodium/calcium exchanger 1-like, partial [Centroberyx affinis]|uniref:sodium/calcium exchanger 1-like n=1 Tax=Centroberyx affinis TaxID=166261 RepID=UPI003A5BE371